MTSEIKLTGSVDGTSRETFVFKAKEIDSSGGRQLKTKGFEFATGVLGFDLRLQVNNYTVTADIKGKIDPNDYPDSGNFSSFDDDDPRKMANEYLRARNQWNVIDAGEGEVLHWGTLNRDITGVVRDFSIRESSEGQSQSGQFEITIDFLELDVVSTTNKKIDL